MYKQRQMIKPFGSERKVVQNCLFRRAGMYGAYDCPSFNFGFSLGFMTLVYITHQHATFM